MCVCVRIYLYAILRALQWLGGGFRQVYSASQDLVTAM